MMSWSSKGRVILLSIVGAVLLGTVVVVVIGQERNRGSVLVYRAGKVTAVSPATAEYLIIQQQGVDLLSGAKTGILEAVTKQTMQMARQEGEAVEITYPGLLDVVNGGHHLMVDRILVVVTGEHYPGWIFYGDQRYSSGPFITTDKSLDPLKAVLQKLK